MTASPCTHQTQAARGLLFALLLLFSCPALLAAALTGTVTNGTTKKPSAGDDVTLMKLAQGMQEVAHTRTDARGRFTLDVPDDGVHLVRVTHDKANYFRPAASGTQSLDVEVFDAAEKVDGVKVEANVRRYETDNTGLKVVENFFVQNQSSPPRTQFGPHSFEFYLPEGAKIDGSAALGPGGMPVQSPAVPAGEKGRYAFLFPIRPGETRFQVSYHVDYPGTLKLTPRVAAPTGDFAVMLPRAMRFQPEAGAAYQQVDMSDTNAQTFLLKDVTPSQPLAFTLSGAGQMPRETQGPDGAQTAGQQDGATTAPGGTPANSATDTRPGGGLGTPGEAPDPLKKYLWWILSGVAILFVAGAALLMRKPSAATATPPARSPEALRAGIAAVPSPAGRTPAPATAASLMNALKDELFAIETERLEGKLSETDYQHQKSALETVLRRALARQNKTGHIA